LFFCAPVPFSRQAQDLSWLLFFLLRSAPYGVCYFPAAAVVISATKDGVKFSTSGDIGTANITVRQNTTADKVSRRQGTSSDP
jgi:hypothetical protein